jgi:hypothetical protein
MARSPAVTWVGGIATELVAFVGCFGRRLGAVVGWICCGILDTTLAAGVVAGVRDSPAGPFGLFLLLTGFVIGGLPVTAGLLDTSAWS